MILPHRRSPSACLLAAVLLVPLARADETEEVVTLPEFNVMSAASNGSYTPEGSTAGSRIAQQYKDLPYDVNVLTADFLNDFAVFTLNDELQYNAALTGADDAGNFNLRGYSGNINLRNGFS